MTRTSSRKTTSRSASKTNSAKPAGPSKLNMLVTLLRGPDGASIDDLAEATGWQKHSVRGAIAGTLKKKGHVVGSELIDGIRRYRIAETAA